MWATEPSTHGGKEGEAELARDRNWFSILKRPILKLPQLLFLVTGLFVFFGHSFNLQVFQN